MRASRGEIKIEEILKEAGLPFKMEYIFPDLRSPNGRPLRFDFVVFDEMHRTGATIWNDKINSLINNQDNKTKYLGTFIDKKDAIKCRLKAEKLYFKEFAPQRHLFKEYGIEDDPLEEK